MNPRLISVTLTGNDAAIIGDALQSVVAWVDACLVIDTGVTDDTLAIARRIVAPDKLHIIRFKWVNDFAKARNFALEQAEALGAQWALILDTDMRYHFQKDTKEKFIDRNDVSVFLIPFAEGTYSKELLLRLPSPYRWQGATHEALVAPEFHVRTTLENLVFHELSKSPEAYRKKFLRDISILLNETAAQPTNPRWWFYLGESYRNLNRNQEAIAAYLRCADLKGWDEEAAWACFQAARCNSVLNRFGDVVTLCTRGLGLHSGIGELAWLAGYACFQQKQDRNAICWAEMAAALGCYRGIGGHIDRIGFKDLPALFEGPEDVLFYAYSRLGIEDRATAAKQRWHAAQQLRLRLQNQQESGGV